MSKELKIKDEIKSDSKGWIRIDDYPVKIDYSMEYDVFTETPQCQPIKFYNCSMNQVFRLVHSVDYKILYWRFSHTDVPDDYKINHVNNKSETII